MAWTYWHQTFPGHLFLAHGMESLASNYPKTPISKHGLELLGSNYSRTEFIYFWMSKAIKSFKKVSQIQKHPLHMCMIDVLSIMDVLCFVYIHVYYACFSLWMWIKCNYFFSLNVFLYSRNFMSCTYKGMFWGNSWICLKKIQNALLYG